MKNLFKIYFELQMNKLVLTVFIILSGTSFQVLAMAFTPALAIESAGDLEMACHRSKKQTVGGQQRPKIPIF